MTNKGSGKIVRCYPGHNAYEVELNGRTELFTSDALHHCLSDEDIARLEDAAFMLGQGSALRRMLSSILTELAVHQQDASKEQMILERAETVAALRELCEKFGDNKWDDSLYLPDVIEKHLGRYLDSI